MCRIMELCHVADTLGQAQNFYEQTILNFLTMCEVLLPKQLSFFKTHIIITIWTVFLSSAPVRYSSSSCFLYHSPPSNYLRKLYGKCTKFSGEIYLDYIFSHSDTSIFCFTVRKMWQNCNTSYTSKWIITVLLYIIKMARTWQYTLQKQTFSTWYYKTLIKLSLRKPSTNYFYQQISTAMLEKIKTFC